MYRMMNATVGTLLLPQAAAGRPVARARVLPRQRNGARKLQRQRQRQRVDAEANPSADTSDLPSTPSTTSPDLGTYVASA
jgi:hypothetical protein